VRSTARREAPCNARCLPASVMGKKKPAAAWEIADKSAVLRRAYLVAPRRVTPRLTLPVVSRLAIPSTCDGQRQCSTAAEVGKKRR